MNRVRRLSPKLSAKHNPYGNYPRSGIVSRPKGPATLGLGTGPAYKHAPPVLADYHIGLCYDFHKGFDTALGSLGKINVTKAILGSATPGTTLIGDPQNPVFGFLASPIPGLITPPAWHCSRSAA